MLRQQAVFGRFHILIWHATFVVLNLYFSTTACMVSQVISSQRRMILCSSTIRYCIVCASVRAITFPFRRTSHTITYMFSNLLSWNLRKYQWIQLFYFLAAKHNSDQTARMFRLTCNFADRIVVLSHNSACGF